LVNECAAATAARDWVSMAVPSDGSYGVAEGIISSFPCHCSGGDYEIVQDLDVPEFSQQRIDNTVEELLGERDAVKELGLV
jgi:malate dehydrogenase